MRIPHMLALFTWCRSYVGFGFGDWDLGRGIYGSRLVHIMYCRHVVYQGIIEGGHGGLPGNLVQFLINKDLCPSKY